MNTENITLVTVDVDIRFIKSNALEVTLTVPENERHKNFTLKAMSEELNGAVAYRSHRSIDHYNAKVTYKWRNNTCSNVNPFNHITKTIEELETAFRFFVLEGYDVKVGKLNVTTSN